MAPNPLKFGKLGLACIAAFAFAAVEVRAQDVAEIPIFNAPVGTSALGGGIRGGQSPYFAIENEDQRKLDLIPLYLYEGKYVFFRGTKAGFHIVDNDTWEVNLLGRYRFQKLDPDSNAFYQGINERKQSLDAGLEFAFTKDWGQLTLSWVTDTLDRHQGQEAEFSYRYVWDLGRWTISPYIGWSWHDENLTDYYFGVSAAEARPDLPEYSAGESQWFDFGLNTSWQVNDRIMLFANVGFTGTETDVINSPLVEEGAASALYLGGTYIFGNARAPDYIIDEDRAGEWSWRVNYGYQADGNIFGEIDQGNFAESDVADTSVTGLMLSKLLGGGTRVDFLGRVAAFRHDEEDEGNDKFWSYAAYIMAMGKGYSPWSKEEIFRWGFGFGFSYAENIPIAEQRKQQGQGAQGNTNHFLNYLEMTIDFPLRRVSKANWLQNCYAGMTIVHRSGIFGTSDLLGDVSGGSDWITAHLECIR